MGADATLVTFCSLLNRCDALDRVNPQYYAVFRKLKNNGLVSTSVYEPACIKHALLVPLTVLTQCLKMIGSKCILSQTATRLSLGCDR